MAHLLDGKLDALPGQVVKNFVPTNGAKVTMDNVPENVDPFPKYWHSNADGDLAVMGMDGVVGICTMIKGINQIGKVQEFRFTDTDVLITRITAWL